MFISCAVDVVNHQQKSFQRHNFYEVIKETKWKIYSTPCSSKEGSGGKVSSVIPWTSIFCWKILFFSNSLKNTCIFYLESKRWSRWFKDFTCVSKPAALNCSTLHFSLKFSVQPAVLLHPVETNNLMLWHSDCLQLWGNWAFSGEKGRLATYKNWKMCFPFTN